MAINLLDMIKDQVGDSVLSQAGKFLGESDSGVKSAMGAALPSILGSLITKGGTNNGAGAIMDMISGGNHDGSIFDNLGGLLGGGDATSGFLNSGSGILKSLLGNKLGSVVDIIASVSGLKKGSSSSIMSMAAPLVMGMLGKYVKNKALDAVGLGKFLGSQKPHVASALPAGMGSLLGFGNQSTSSNTGGTRVTETSHSAPTGGSSGGGGGFMKRVLPILGLLLLGWAGWNFFLKDSAVGDMASNATEAVTDVAGGAVDAVGDAAGSAAGAVGDAAKGAADMAGDAAKGAADMAGDAAGAVGDAAKGAADMAGDAAGAVGDAAKGAMNAASAAAAKALEGVKFAAGSVGEKFSNFLSTGKGEGVFRFNNMKFATGSATIDGGSMSEVDNLAKVLNAYKNVAIEVGGHTDNTGNAENNNKLSNARAAAVKARLVAQGVAADRISTKGYGSASPSASNDTAEGRAQNRRIEVKVTKK